MTDQKSKGVTFTGYDTVSFAIGFRGFFAVLQFNLMGGDGWQYTAVYVSRSIFLTGNGGLQLVELSIDFRRSKV